jgi:hypothetical protein
MVITIEGLAAKAAGFGTAARKDIRSGFLATTSKPNGQHLCQDEASACEETSKSWRHSASVILAVCTIGPTS